MHVGAKSSKIELKSRKSVKSLWSVWFSLDVGKIVYTFDEKDRIWKNVTITMKNNKYNFLGAMTRSSTSGNSLNMCKENYESSCVYLFDFLYGWECRLWNLWIFFYELMTFSLNLIYNWQKVYRKGDFLSMSKVWLLPVLVIMYLFYYGDYYLCLLTLFLRLEQNGTSVCKYLFMS